MLARAAMVQLFCVSSFSLFDQLFSFRWRARLRNFTAGVQSQNDVSRASIGNIVLRVPALRRREPPSAGALVLLEPGDTATDGRVVDRHSRLPQYVERHPRRIAIACQ